MMALQAVRWTMWYRNRVAIQAIAAFMLATCGLFLATNVQKLPGLLVVAVVITGIFAYLVLFGVFIHQDAEVGTKGSSFPVYLFSLPIRTWQLVLVPMMLGTFAMLGTGFALTWAARHGDVDMPQYWPSFMVASFLALLQATFWYPIGFSYSKLIMTLVGIPAVAFYVGVAVTEKVAEANVCGGLSLFILLMYGLAYHGVVRARKGEGQLLRIQREEAAEVAKEVRWLKPFGSAAAAQRWYEWRQHGVVLPSIVLFLFALFVVPLFFKDTYTPLTFLSINGGTTVPTVRTYVWAYFPTLMGLIPICAWIVGCGARRSDVKHSDRTLQLFFGVRPMSDNSMVAQKLWAALKCTLVAWGLILVAMLLLLLLKGGRFDLMTGSYVDEELRPIFLTLQPYLSLQVLLMTGGGLLLLIATTWRNYAVGYWIELSGIPWIHIGYPFGTFFVIFGTMVGSGALPQEFVRHWVTPINIDIVVWALVVVKLVVAGILVIKQTRSGLLSGKTIIRGSVSYLVAIAIVLSIVFALSQPLRENFVRSDVCSMQTINLFFIGMTIFWTPIVRILLAPMMLARNRHRAR